MRNDLQQQIGAFITPLRNQIANLATRAVIKVIDNTPAMQRAQALAEEGTIEDVEHFQPYGLSAVPVAGAEGVILCAGGDRAVPIAVVVSEPGTRPTGQVAGEVTLYHRGGARVEMKANGDVRIYPSGTGRVRVGSASATEKAARNKEVEDLYKAIALAPTLAGDGGATFKTAILNALPPGFPAGAQKVTVE